MRKFIPLVLVGAALALAAPQSGSAAPAAPGAIAAAADHVAQVGEARYWRHGRWHRGWRHRHCWHRRYSSGRRCRW